MWTHDLPARRPALVAGMTEDQGCPQSAVDMKADVQEAAVRTLAQDPACTFALLRLAQSPGKGLPRDQLAPAGDKIELVIKQARYAVTAITSAGLDLRTDRVDLIDVYWITPLVAEIVKRVLLREGRKS